MVSTWAKRLLRKHSPQVSQSSGAGASSASPLDSVAGVDEHYEQFCRTYQECYGDVVQAYRSANVDDLLAAELEGMELADGMKVLDAGCGFCGPAIWFAQRLGISVEAITLSNAMANRAAEAVRQARLHKRIRVRTGDFHKLPEIYKDRDFDRVYFLETVGYGKPLSAVLRATYEVLKPGGCVYVKDWWNPVFPADSEAFRLSQALYQGYLDEYGYRTYLREEFLAALASAGFEVVTARVMSLPNDPTEMNRFDRAVGNTWDQHAEPLQAAGGIVRWPCEMLARRPA